LETKPGKNSHAGLSECGWRERPWRQKMYGKKQIKESTRLESEKARIKRW